MKKALMTLVAFALLGAPLAAQTPMNPDKGSPSIVSETTLGCTAIPDDGYDGTMGTMGCIAVPGADLIIEDVTLDLSMNHTWVGDLTVKVWSPTGTVTTVMSRTGFDEMVDDGTGCCGTNAQIISSSPVNFSNAGTTDAEALGVAAGAGGVACQDDGLCSYFPFPDSAPGVSLSDFNGENGLGDWMICVGDSAAADTGDICDATVNITGTPPGGGTHDIAIPTLDYVGLAALLAALGLAGVVFLRRRA